jgi:ABC-2 type transport system permease protein
MNPRRIGSYFRIFALGYLRSRIGLFFALVFPVILILLFGAIFSNSGVGHVDLYVQDLDHASPASQAFLAALNQTGVVSVHLVSPQAGNLSQWLLQNDQTLGLVIPAGFQAAYLNHTPVRVTLITDPAEPSSSGVVEGAVQGVINGFNLRAAGGTPVVGLATSQVGSQVYTYIDYLIPGLIGFTILTSPMFSMVNISSEWKREKLFRQLSLTPLTRAEWLTAALGWYILISAVSALLMVAVETAVFGAHVGITLAAVPFLLLGPLLFVSLGLLAGSVSRNPESAAVVGNIITFPMMFLAGTFFPVSLFPPWLQTVAHVLPLYYLIDGLNQAMLFHSAAAYLQDLEVVAVLTVIFSVAAVRVFRWSET